MTKKIKKVVKDSYKCEGKQLPSAYKVKVSLKDKILKKVTDIFKKKAK